MLKTISVGEFAEQIGVKKPRGYQILREGKVPGVVHIGRNVRLIEEKFEAWLEAGGSPLEDDGQADEAAA